MGDPACCKPLQVLADSNKREIYDRYGEEGLKQGGGGNPAAGRNGGGGGQYAPQRPEDIFAQVRNALLSGVKNPKI